MSNFYEDEPHIDHEAVEELKCIMEDEFETLIHLYISDSKERVSQLKLAVEKDDIELATKTAHSFKGASSNIGAKRLFSLCKSAEEAGRAQDMNQIKDAFTAIQTEYDEVTRQLQSYL